MAALLVVYIHNERVVAEQHTHTDNDWSLIARPITLQDHTIGDVAAPVQVIVYSDFACKYCATLFQETIPELRKVFGNQIVIAYRHRVLSSAPQSKIEEEASECVYQGGGNIPFWNFANLMFVQPLSVNKNDPALLSNFAQKSGAGFTAYGTCMSTHAGATRVEADTLEASVAGIDTDPSVILKSRSRALVIKSGRYSLLYTGIQYLLNSNTQSAAQK